MRDTDLDSQLQKMQRDWDERAKENARYFVATAKKNWSDEEYFHSGRQTVEGDILPDMQNICQGRNPKQMKVLEIGCGTGRVTRALADLFGEVYAVDISEEMVKQARLALADQPNVHIYQNNGKDLPIPGELVIDFAFSVIVFQHVTSQAIVESYVREVYRLLRPGGLFKFQVQGYTALTREQDDTWLGVPFSEKDAEEMAERCGFELRYRQGVGEQYFWLWYFKREVG
ncbi:MAG: class I SAM-dependent methyltransferase [Acidobacteria bacterium]|nr:class I SAM-dependent methyltransferase [Acidobacteriota bacterium]MBI3656890.1 class I SAM-dependent methyltransferase [Acidobacteriota bacterium]